MSGPRHASDPFIRFPGRGIPKRNMLHFLNSALLYGLAGIAIPVLIHFFARRKPKRVPFGHIRFIQAVQNKSLRRLRIRQILVLLLRVLALLMIILAFARPAMRRFAGMGAHAASSLVLVVDQSASMNREGAADAAREAALAVLDQMESSDEAALLATSGLAAPQAGLSRDKGYLRESASRMTLSETHGHLSILIAQAAARLADSRNANREIFVVSDMQRSEFDPRILDSLALKPDRILFLPVGGGSDNLSVSSIGLRNRILVPEMPLPLTAEIQNHSEKGGGEVTARFYRDGEMAGQKTVRVQAGSAARVDFPLRTEKPGWLKLRMEIPEDYFPLDNTGYLAVPIPEKITLFLVGRLRSDILPLKRALAPERRVSGIFDIREFTDGGNWIEDLDDADAVFFSGAAGPGPDARDRLKTYVRAGRGLFWIMGERSDPKAVAALLAVFDPSAAAGSLQAAVSPEAFWSLGRIAWEHPIFDGIFEKRPASLPSPRFYRVVPVVRTRARPVMELSDGTPLLLDFPAGSGHMLFFASGLDSSWSDMTFAMIFAPLIHRSALYLASSGGASLPAVYAGDPLKFGFVPGVPGAAYSAEYPDSRRVFLLPEGQGAGLLRLPSAGRIGFYSFFENDRLIGVSAVNPDPKESDLRALEGDLQAFFPGIPVHRLAETQDIGKKLRAIRYGTELWKGCLALALMFLLAETALSQGFSLRKRQGSGREEAA